MTSCSAGSDRPATAVADVPAPAPAERPTCVGMMDDALALQRAGRDVVNLGKGELDFETPQVIKEAAIQALAEGKTAYTTSVGLDELRQALGEHYLRSYGVDVDPTRIIVNSGSSPALLTVFLALLEPGDEVVLPDPSYSSYRRLIESTGAKPVLVPTRPAGFRYTAAAAAEYVTAATKAILVNFPSNPLGATADRAELAAFADLGPLVIADEVYHGLSERPDPSILECTDDAVVVNSFSKAFAMTGWRLGYVVLPPRLVPLVTPLHQDAFISPNAFVQWAGIAALAHAEQIQPRWRAELRSRRELLVDRLTALGFEIAVPPDGAFYVFCKLPAGHTDAYDFAARLLREADVVVTPGPEFGPDAAGYVRFSYATPAARIEEAADRIGAFIQE